MRGYTKQELEWHDFLRTKIDSCLVCMSAEYVIAHYPRSYAAGGNDVIPLCVRCHHEQGSYGIVSVLKQWEARNKFIMTDLCNWFKQLTVYENEFREKG